MAPWRTPLQSYFSLCFLYHRVGQAVSSQLQLQMGHRGERSEANGAVGVARKEQKRQPLPGGICIMSPPPQGAEAKKLGKSFLVRGVREEEKAWEFCPNNVLFPLALPPASKVTASGVLALGWSLGI